PRTTNLALDNFTGSIYIITTELDDDEQQIQSMLTSPRTNSVDHLIPSHRVALITQPVLGARSRSRKKPTNILEETSSRNKANTHRRSYNDSPSLVIPVHRVDTSQYQKSKTYSNSHRESSDSGLDLSSSTTSSVQLQQYSQSHPMGHRPLSALNEDSSTDDGYHDDQQQQQQTSQSSTRLRFPPVNFGRNRSMEDMLGTQKREQQRSGSFTDEHQLRIPSRHDHKMKRSSEGALLDLLDNPTNSSRRSNAIRSELLYPTAVQHRSLNDLIDKHSNPASRNESNMSTNMTNLVLTQTVIRKPNASTLKPLRKKTKLNIIIEPAVPLTSSRLAIYDEQVNEPAEATSGSSNQTTPRSIQPTVQQHQVKSKTTTPLDYYPNPEHIKTHVNRSVVERQHHPPGRRGVLQQLVPFDASPSKVNKLLRHHVQHQHPTTSFYPSMHIAVSPSRQLKQTSRTHSNDDETFSNIDDDKRKQRLKQKNDFDNSNNKLPRRFKNHNDKTSVDQNVPKYFIKTTQRTSEKFPTKKISHNRSIENLDERQSIENMFTSTPRHQQEYRERHLHITEANRNRRGSGQSNSTTGKSQDSKTFNRRHLGYQLDPLRTQEFKSTEVKVQNHTNERNMNKPNEFHSQHRVHKYPYADSQIYPSKTFEASSNRNSILLNPIHLNEQQTKQKPQIGVTLKTVRLQPFVSTNTYQLQREREISQLSDTSKAESTPTKQQTVDKDPTVDFRSRSPTSWSVISEHQKHESSQDDLNEKNNDEPLHTYRIATNDQEQTVPSSLPSSLIDHTYPFTFTPDSEINDNPGSSKEKSNLSDIYMISERDSTQKIIDQQSPKKKYYSPPPKVTIVSDKDEVPSNYDSDDGWSDDSAELLYVDERYAKEKKKLSSSTHLSNQQHYYYQIQQQNVLL
ncbi:unnamed protein product, partial [Adineta ricciae]